MRQAETTLEQPGRLESLEPDLRQPLLTLPTEHIEHPIRKVFRRVISSYVDSDSLVIEKDVRNLSITYYSASASTDDWDQTRITLRLHPDIGEMWIDSLRVAVAYRSRGLGAQLVVAAEAIACAAQLPVIHVFPLLAAQSFWERNAYRHSAHRSRVLFKRVSSIAREGFCKEASLCRSVEARSLPRNAVKAAALTRLPTLGSG